MKSTGFERITAFALLAAGLAVAIIGFLSLLGWVLDIPILTQWKAGTQHMAPSTAILSVLYGMVLCFGVLIPRRRLTLLLIAFIGVAGFITALLLFVLRLQGVHLPVELLGLRITGTISNTPIGYIAPITAFCFLLSYASLLVPLPYGLRKSWQGWLMFGFGGIVLMVSFVILLAYIFGLPLLSGKTLIPTALSTSFSLLIMGLAQLALAARYSYQSEASLEADIIKLLPYALAFLIFAAGIFAAAYYFYLETELRFHQAVESQLLTISELKTDELVRWRKERMWDGILTQNAVLTTAVRQLLETPHSLSAQREMQDLLGKYQRYNGYGRAFLLDATGVTLMSVPYKKEPTAAILVERAAESLRTDQIMLQDFYRDEHDQRVYLALVVPILDKQGGNRPLGVLVLRIDPTIHLYPDIKRWPAPSTTAETLLVRREGNDVLFLNDLRFKENAALTLRLPLKNNTQLPAVKAVLGQRGIVDGLDYRSVPVIAAVRAVPNSPWFIVARMDISEVYAPLRERMRLTLLLVSVMICSAGFVVILLWRQQKIAFYQKQFKLISKLQESHERLEFALQKMHAGGWDLNLNDNTALRTREHDRIFGYETPLPKWTYNMFLEHVVPEDRPEVDRRFRKAIEKGSDWNFECRIIRRSDHQIRWIWAIGGHIHSGKDGTGRMTGIVQDITERKQVEEKLHLAASVFTHAREGIMITEADGTIIDVNAAFCDIAGFNRDEVLGRNPRILKSDRHDKEFFANMWRDLIEQGYWHGEIWNRRKNSELYASIPTISAVRDEQGNIRQYVALYTDITPFKEHEQKLERSAHFDLLTNLPNRVLLADRLHQGIIQARRREQRLAVALLDLDGFKAINDNYGHDAGDQLLIVLAAYMKQALREGDTLARLGGDEFVAVLIDVGEDIEASRPILNRLLTAAAEQVQLDGLTLQVSASLGVTFYPQAEDIDADQLLRQADQAMYQAKQEGKNRCHFFDAEQDDRVRSRYESQEHIRRALDAGEFVLYYQPKVNMRTGTVIGVEALIRWQHPEKGLLLPDQFLPVIEDHLLSVELGEWVINTALLQMESWQAAGLNIPVSINVGARHLQLTDFAERLRILLAAHPNIKPGDVELEILETNALEDLFKISKVIDDCRKMGVSFALDDFGTGYSSLSYLKHLPVTQLKIDHSFVGDMIDNPDDLSIVEGVISLGTAFRLLVIAEGTETVEHSTILLQLGCDLAQGYGIAHPMPAHQLREWEATWRPDPLWSGSPPFSRGDLPLLFASVEHRAWIAAIEKYLKDEREAPLPLDIRQCRFGQWLNTDGLTHFGERQNFQVVELLHWQVHALALELYKLHEQGRKQEALARLGELHTLRDTLLERLMLVQQGLL